MKKKLLFPVIVLLLMFSTGSKSQVFIGGSLNLNLRSDDGGSNSYTNFSPRVGYRLSEVLAVGGRLSIAQNKSKDANGDVTNKNTETTIGGFGRYYFSASDSKVRFYGQGAADIMLNKIVVGTNENSSTSFGLGIRPGIEVGVSEKIKLDVLFGAAGLTLGFDGGGNQVYLNLNQLSFGLIYEL